MGEVSCYLESSGRSVLESSSKCDKIDNEVFLMVLLALVEMVVQVVVGGILYFKVPRPS